MDLEIYKAKLEEAGVVFAEGLSDSEIRWAEESYGFSFPPDLRTFLMFALPTGKSWPNWRELDSSEIWRMLNWPYEGMCFDIENNVFWPPDWGTKPASLADSCDIAKRIVEAAPKLIPICGHRYLPDRPAIDGNPVLSVYQTDIIYYGSNLRDYFQNEFHYYFGPAEYQTKEPIRRIEFWSDIVEGNS
jgi:hypothetical protein